MVCNTSFAEVIKIDCQLSETPGLELPSEDLILLKQRTKPTFKINLDSKEVIAFNYGHSNKNNVKIGMVKISDSEKIVWDEEPYRAGLVTYHRWTYHKNEKKLLEEYINNYFADKNVIILGDLNDEIQEEEANNVFWNFISKPDEYLFAEEYCSSFTSEYQQDSWAHIGSDVFWKAKSGQIDYIYFAGICGINAILGDNSKYKRIIMSRIRAAINGYKSESIYLKEEKKNPGKMLTIADRDLYRKIKKLEDWNYFRRYTYNNRLTYYSTQVKDPNELMGMVLEDRSKRKNGIDKVKEHKLKKKFGLI